MPSAEQRAETRPGVAAPAPLIGWTCVAADLATEALAAYGAALGSRSLQAAVDGLLEAISHSSEWQQLPESHLVATLSPRPRIAAFGRFDATAVAALEAQARQLDSACRHFLRLDFADVQADCRRLAEQLKAQLGEELATARFVAIPRGGLVVLGLLASELGLRTEQLVAVGDLEGEAICVVVDDCAISGACLNSFLPSVDASRIIFAHLVSPPDLRAACEATEPRVEACLAARDLPLIDLGDEAVAWRRQWQARDGDGRYWLGCPVPFCLPWNEPERQLWNPASRLTENAWQMAPPADCSKNGSWPAEQRPRLHRPPEALGPLRPAAGVMAVSPDRETIVVAAGAGQCYELRGVAAGVWNGVLEQGRLDPVIDDLAAAYEVGRDDLARDCRALVDDLLARSLLVDSPVAG